MKKFAAHFLFLPNVGFLKQGVVEVDIDGTVTNISLLTEERESIEWFPGVIALSSELEYKNGMIFKIIPSHSINGYIQDQNLLSLFQLNLSDKLSDGIVLKAYLYYPFDFILMQPADGTQHKRLQ